MQNYIISPAGFNTVINNTAYNIPKADSRYASIIKALSLPKAEQEQAVLDIIKGNVKKDDPVTKGFVITDTDVYFRDQKLVKQNADIVRKIYEDGLPLDYYMPFADNLDAVTDKEVHEHLWKFMSYKALPITSDGHILAWKGVQQNYRSVMGNPETVVFSGDVDSGGHILNDVGAKISAKRNRMSTDRNVYCDPWSLHVGSLDYAKSWGSRVVIVKIHPKDVVCVPDDCNYQKMRVCAYEVVADFVEEITAPVVDSDNKPVQNVDNQERSQFVQRIEQYLLNKKNQSINTVTFRQIQSIFSPEWPTKLQIQEALQQLEYSWSGEEVNTYKLGDYQMKSSDSYDDDYNEYDDNDDWYDDGYDDDDED
jgi:hypothetical protein